MGMGSKGRGLVWKDDMKGMGRRSGSGKDGTYTIGWVGNGRRGW